MERLFQSRASRERQDPTPHHGKPFPGKSTGRVFVLLLSLLALAGCGMGSGVGSNNSQNHKTTSSAQLSVNPSSISFADTAVGSPGRSQPITLSNSGGKALNLSSATVSGPGFGVSGLSLPLTLDAGQSTSFDVTFSPKATGTASGSMVLTSDAVDSSVTVSLHGKAVALQLSVTPATVAFGNVVVGDTNTQTVAVANAGKATLKLSQANVSGAGYKVTGLTLPLTLSAGQQATFNVAFAPGSAKSFSGQLSLVSNAADSPTAIPLSGTGVAAASELSASPASLSFGNVTVNQSSTKSVSISNTGNADVKISQVSVSGTGFTASGLTPPVTLNPGQNATVSVVFAPTTSGSATGSLSIVSDASNSPGKVALSGSGVDSTSHSVKLGWSASSTSSVTGYNVYRGSQAGGPYTKLNSSLITGTSYTDSTVQAGNTYYYVTTAVDSSNAESPYSNQVSATIPSP